MNNNRPNHAGIGFQIDGYKEQLGDTAKLDPTTQVATVEILGRRNEQEDAFSNTPLGPASATLEDPAVKEAYRSAFNSTFKAMQKKHGEVSDDNPLPPGGSTVATVIAHLDDKNIAHVALAHVGDTETFVVVLDQDGRVSYKERLNKELHNAKSTAERERIEKSGRFVFMNRVAGVLAVTRSIGDWGILNCYSISTDEKATTKQIDEEDSQPEIQFLDLELSAGQRAFVISACDGLCEQVKEDQEKPSWIADVVKQHASSPLETAKQLVKKAFESGSTDNITANVLALEKGKPPIAIVTCDGHGGSDVSRNVNRDFLPTFWTQLQLAIDPSTPTVDLPKPIVNPLFQALDNLENEDKSKFIDTLLDVLLNTETVTTKHILELFNELKKPDGEFKYIHRQKHPTIDRFFLLFKSSKNKGEKNFWHTATYQKAVKALKQAYLSKQKEAGISYSTESDQGKAFIDYTLGNAPVHFKHTSSYFESKKISKP